MACRVDVQKASRVGEWSMGKGAVLRPLSRLLGPASVESACSRNLLQAAFG